MAGYVYAADVNTLAQLDRAWQAERAAKAQMGFEMFRQGMQDLQAAKSRRAQENLAQQELDLNRQQLQLRESERRDTESYRRRQLAQESVLKREEMRNRLEEQRIRNEGYLRYQAGQRQMESDARRLDAQAKAEALKAQQDRQAEMDVVENYQDQINKGMQITVGQLKKEATQFKDPYARRMMGSLAAQVAADEFRTQQMLGNLASQLNSSIAPEVQAVREAEAAEMEPLGGLPGSGYWTPLQSNRSVMKERQQRTNLAKQQLRDKADQVKKLYGKEAAAMIQWDPDAMQYFVPEQGQMPQQGQGQPPAQPQTAPPGAPPPGPAAPPPQTALPQSTNAPTSISMLNEAGVLTPAGTTQNQPGFRPSPYTPALGQQLELGPRGELQLSLPTGTQQIERRPGGFQVVEGGYYSPQGEFEFLTQEDRDRVADDVQKLLRMKDQNGRQLHTWESAVVAALNALHSERINALRNQ